MIFDMQQPTMAEGGIVYPVWPFPDLPRQPGQVKDTAILGASNVTSVAIAGTADPEN